MTQEKANEMFKTELGQQLSVIYVTSDDKPFIKFTEAMNYANEGVDDNGKPLKDSSISEWYPEN